MEHRLMSKAARIMQFEGKVIARLVNLDQIQEAARRRKEDPKGRIKHVELPKFTDNHGNPMVVSYRHKDQPFGHEDEKFSTKDIRAVISTPRNSLDTTKPDEFNWIHYFLGYPV